MRDYEFYCPAIDNAMAETNITVTLEWRMGSLRTEVRIDGLLREPEVLYALMTSEQRVEAWILGLRHDIYVGNIEVEHNRFGEHSLMYRRVMLRSYATLTRHLHPVVLRRELKRKQREQEAS